MAEILQNRIPYDPLSPRPLPGIQPLKMDEWLLRDDAFAGQMARRDELLRESRSQVTALQDCANAPAQELLDLVLATAYPEARESAVRPDGAMVPIDRSDPMGTMVRLVQEDLCILQKQGDEHVLTGAALCFPASWNLAEKFGRPLIAIHEPVDDYDPGTARRVQRLFDGVQPEKPIWRFNALWYHDPELFQPRSFLDRRVPPSASEGEFLRSERQVILRLPQSRAVVFAIHTFVLARQDVMRTAEHNPQSIHSVLRG